VLKLDLQFPAAEDLPLSSTLDGDARSGDRTTEQSLEKFAVLNPRHAKIDDMVFSDLMVVRQLAERTPTFLHWLSAVSDISGGIVVEFANFLKTSYQNDEPNFLAALRLISSQSPPHVKAQRQHNLANEHALARVSELLFWAEILSDLNFVHTASRFRILAQVHLIFTRDINAGTLELATVTVAAVNNELPILTHWTSLKQTDNNQQRMLAEVVDSVAPPPSPNRGRGRGRNGRGRSGNNRGGGGRGGGGAPREKDSAVPRPQQAAAAAQPAAAAAAPPAEKKNFSKKGKDQK
jgi:hypothetical protein